jgi:hypothetical protein
VVPHLRLLDDANSSSGRQRPCCTGRKLAGADLVPQAPWALQSRRAGIDDAGAKAALAASAVCAPSVAVAKSASAFSATWQLEDIPVVQFPFFSLHSIQCLLLKDPNLCAKWYCVVKKHIFGNHQYPSYSLEI